MKARTLWILAAVIALTLASLLLAPAPEAGPDGEAAEAFAGADGKAEEMITRIAPDYEPWFEPLFEPAGETESMLFALQAALGAGVIGYWLGTARTRARMRREHDAETGLAN